MKQYSGIVTYRQIALFWLPLAVTWLMMSIEGPFVAALIARMPDAKMNLAAYGVAQPLGMLVEAPVIMLMSAATALAIDSVSYHALKRFSIKMNIGVTVIAMLVSLPFLFQPLATVVIGLPEELAHRANIAFAFLIPWPAAIGIRRFYQGIIIRSGQTRRVTYGTVIRLAGMTAAALLVSAFTPITGAAVGTIALSSGVIVEAIAIYIMSRPAVQTVKATAPAHASEHLTDSKIMAFYLPLALTPLIALAGNPIATFFMGRSVNSVESMAIMPVVASLVFIFRSFGLAYQETALTLMGKGFEHYPVIRRFATGIGLFALTGMLLIAWTPFAEFWFITVSGLSRELADFALTPLRIMAVLPCLTLVLSFQRAVLMNGRMTKPITYATVIEIGVLILVTFTLIHTTALPGAVCAAYGFLAGRLLANLYLTIPFRKVLALHGITQG